MVDASELMNDSVEIGISLVENWDDESEVVGTSELVEESEEVLEISVELLAEKSEVIEA